MPVFAPDGTVISYTVKTVAMWGCDNANFREAKFTHHHAIILQEHSGILVCEVILKKWPTVTHNVFTYCQHQTDMQTQYR